MTRLGPAVRSLRAHPGRLVAVLALVLLVLGLAMADALLAEPLRRAAERKINASLDGYHVRIARARPHLEILGLDLEGIVLVQASHPDPPVAEIGSLRFSLDGRSLLRLRLAGSLTFLRPSLHINLPQIQAQVGRKRSLREQGWQRAVEGVYPFRLNRVEIQDGDLRYLADATAARPLELTGIRMVAGNVRNIASARGTFPSPLGWEARVFGAGTVRFRGEADFLREPHAAVRGEIHLAGVPLDRLAPLAVDASLRMTGGLLSADGTLEAGPEGRSAHLREVRLDGLNLDYVTRASTQAEEAARGREALRLAKAAHREPGLRLRMDALRVVNSQLGFVNASAKPPYRLFLSDASLDLRNLSNLDDPEGVRFQMKGAFMGAGSLSAEGRARPYASPADFSGRLTLRELPLPRLNDLCLSAAGVDFAGGALDVYGELAVKNGRVEGYLKPLARDVRISDPRKDRGRSWGKRVELGALQVLAGLFKNARTQRIATETRISGRTGDPRFDGWQAIRKLLVNGLLEPIRPGFANRRTQGR